MWAACQYFSEFAKAMEEKVNEVEEALRKADHALFSAQGNIRSIIKTLKRVQDEFITEMKAAQAKAREEAYTAAIIGLIFGPIGLMISYAVTTGVVEGVTVKEIEEDFAKQQDILSGYIDGFEQMYTDAKELQERLKKKRTQLIEIHSKLSATGSLSGINSKSLPVLHFNIVRQSAEDLVKACDAFLAMLK